jgi:hypothetical protein
LGKSLDQSASKKSIELEVGLSGVVASRHMGWDRKVEISLKRDLYQEDFVVEGTPVECAIALRMRGTTLLAAKKDET